MHTGYKHCKDFDESIGKINIVPQDIGRVLLNLFTNAFLVHIGQKNNLIPLAKRIAFFFFPQTCQQRE